MRDDPPNRDPATLNSLLRYTKYGVMVSHAGPDPLTRWSPGQEVTKVSSAGGERGHIPPSPVADGVRRAVGT